MSCRVPPLTWPALVLLSPFWLPIVLRRYGSFKKDRARAEELNRSRIDAAGPLEIPEIDDLEIRVLSEWRAKEGFTGEAGVSYLFRTNLGSLLYDVAFGDGTGAVAQNAQRLGVTAADFDAVAISHLHNDHMGGMKAYRAMQVEVPKALRPTQSIPGYLPAEAGMEGFAPEVVTEPRLLTGGIVSTGPLARRLFFLGWTEEQALVMRLRGKGLVVFTGCGHPTLSVILRMVHKLSNEAIYAIGGGLHFPVTGGRVRGPGGVDLQRFLGTGKPPWRRITEKDLDAVIETIRAERPKRLFLSAHDTCDHALDRIARASDAQVEVLEAGGTYTL
jgi:7,8-dihydropterin-6-yl-methyl-4-(beta-D-ribofuranosyl)aminobenzene 5'-phosphate synthase